VKITCDYSTGCPRRKVSILGGHSIGHSKQKFICTCVLFRSVSKIELFHCTVPKLLIRKRYYLLFLIPVFIVQVTKLVQFTKYNSFSKIPPSTSMHFAARVRTWRVARLYSVQCTVYFWDTLYIQEPYTIIPFCKSKDKVVPVLN
jgi:hypothetical protein